MKMLLMLSLLFGGVSDEEPPPLVVEKEEVAWEYACGTSSTKTYMDYRAITNRESQQYKYIQNNMEVRNGLLYDTDGSIGVALGSWWGAIGSKWTVELSNGEVYDIVKIDEKANHHTIGGCHHIGDGSVIEFVIDTQTIPIEWWGGNGLVFNGNFNNSPQFNGEIVRIGKKYTYEVEIDVMQLIPERIDFQTKRPYLQRSFFMFSNQLLVSHILCFQLF